MKDRLPTTVPIDAWLVANLPKNAKVRCLTRVGYSDEKVAKRNSRDFGREIAHGAVTRRPPNPSETSVARTEGYTYAARVSALSLFQGPKSISEFGVCSASRWLATLRELLWLKGVIS